MRGIATAVINAAAASVHGDVDSQDMGGETIGRMSQALGQVVNEDNGGG